MHATTQLVTRTLVAFALIISLALVLPQSAIAAESTHASATGATAKIEATAAQSGGKVGSTYKIAGNVYKVTSNAKNTATLVRAKNVKSIAIPAAVEIGGKAYKVTAVSPKAFRAAKRLSRVSIGDNVTRVERLAFSGCAKLTEVTGGTSVKIIGAYAFNSCEMLKQCSPFGSEKLVKIGACAFKNAKALKTVTVKSAKLKKTSVRKALKGSAIATERFWLAQSKPTKPMQRNTPRSSRRKTAARK